MEEADELLIPTAAEDEHRATPMVRVVADLIAALAATDGLVAPRRFEKALAAAQDAGNLFSEASLMRVLALRALASPISREAAIDALEAAVDQLAAPQRAKLMRTLGGLLDEPVTPVNAGLAVEIAQALNVPLPEHFKRAVAGGSILGDLAGRAKRFMRSDPPEVVAGRAFACEFGEPRLFEAVQQAERSGNLAQLPIAMRGALAAVHQQIDAIVKAADAQADALKVAAELEEAAAQIELVAQQRYAAISRRAKMLKRHLAEDLHALVEDAAEEFEVDFRRLAEQRKGWFGKAQTEDLNDRQVVKNLERRYRQLARRYQDNLDLLDREVSEVCAEFTRASDEALRPVARYEFRSIAPNASMELRLKAAVDRAATRTLVTGAAGAVAGGIAVNAGAIAATTIAGIAAAPVGVAVLGAVAAAGIWKMFATPDDRRRRDQRERARTLEENLRDEVMKNLPRFEDKVDAIVDRFRSAAVPDVSTPRIEAVRLREIATNQRDMAQAVVATAKLRMGLLLPFIGDSVEGQAAGQSGASPNA